MVGKLPLKGITVLSNSEGIISLDGYNYAVSLSFSLFSFSDVTITDLASGRGCVASVSGEGGVIGFNDGGNDQYEGLGSLFGGDKFSITTTSKKVTNPSAEVTDAEHQKNPVSESMHLKLISQRRFALVPTVKLGFRDDFRGIEEHLVFRVKTRKVVVETIDGSLLGYIKMNGSTILDGFSGTISFPRGESYSVELKTGIGGVKMVNLLDRDGGRNCSIEM